MNKVTTGDAQIDLLAYQYAHEYHRYFQEPVYYEGMERALKTAHAALCAAVKMKLCQCKATAVIVTTSPP